MPVTKQGMTTDAIEELIAQRLADALETYEANRNTRNGNANGSGSQSDGRSGSKRTVHTARGCTYKEFLSCQPLNFKGTEGALGLAQWFEKIESVFHINNCAVECQVRYAICTLLNGALTWWNSNVRTVRHDAAYEMSWKDLMIMMTEAYCPRNEIQKLENEMVPEEEDKIPNSLKDQKVRAYAARQADNKRRMDNNPRDNHAQQPPNKRQNVARVYIAGPSKKSEYAGTLPLCNKCKLHHNGPCTAMCGNYKKVGHLARDCRGTTATLDQKTPMANQRTLTCFECGNQGHYHSECPKLKNQNCGNQTRNGEARGIVYALGGAEADKNPNNIADDTNA
ncbi:reverse transcriptase domain-containing protein [Tanacetum coccineum]|uniref:Reverse transcriptase domain-containing protein n=1 Tax=Tanacetum coccineum TaxID=301880 RepID=A0ABQ4Z6X1_9ASTR